MKKLIKIIIILGLFLVFGPLFPIGAIPILIHGMGVQIAAPAAKTLFLFGFCIIGVPITILGGLLHAIAKQKENSAA